MKTKQLLLLSVAFLSQLSFSQAYTKLPADTNYFWRQLSDCGFQYQIRYYKDTVIRGLPYGKYSLFGATTGTACSPSFVKNGYIRQDSLNKRVVVMDANFNERPLYNFNKVAGDTLLIYDRVSDTNLTYTVQSTMLGGSFQTLIRNNYTYFVAEGIGSYQGGLYACQQSLYPINTEKLVCFGKINPYQVLEGPEVGFEGMCYLITGVEARELNELQMKLYPNPGTGQYYVVFDTFYDARLTYKVYDLLGQEVKTGDCVPHYGENEIRLNITDAPAGMYTFNIFDSKNAKRLYTQKLVKN